MPRSAPRRDIDESKVVVSSAQDHAAGVKAVAVAMKRAFDEMGAVRSART